jgi:TonB family protein
MKTKTLALLAMVAFCSGFATLNYQPGENKTSEKINAALEVYNNTLPQEKVYLHFDKPMYEPGDDIWFKVYITDAITHQLNAPSEVVYIELINPKGNVEKKLRLIAKGGTTKGDFKLADSAPGGSYKIRAYTSWMKNFYEVNYFSKNLQVQNVILPRLLMNLSFQRKAYGAGEKPIAKLKLATIENRPLVDYEFNFTVKLDGRSFKMGKGITNEKGVAYIEFPLPKNLNTSDGLLNVKINHEGTTESISRSIPITFNNIDLQFFPEGGDLVNNVKSNTAFKALNEFGKPADIEGIILNNKGKKVADFKSYHQGMGAFSFKPQFGQKYTAKITAPEGIVKTYTLPKILDKAYALLVQKPGKNQLSVEVHSPSVSPITIVAQVRGKIQYSKTITPIPGKNTVAISTEEFPIGVAQITVFDAQANPHCERLIFVNKHKQLNIDISTDKEKYLPREKVTMNIAVKDENGQPIPANLSLAVVDDKLISFADNKDDNLLSYLLVSSDVKGKIEEPNFYFKTNEPKADLALDYLLMTQGWRKFTWKEVLTSNEKTLVNQVKHLPEKAAFKGKIVLYKNEKPTENATVTIPETGQTVQTDAEGKFEFSDIDLTKSLTLKATTEKGVSRVLQINNFAPDYVLQDLLSGTVTTTDGQPIPFAEVLIKETHLYTKADKKGHYEFTSVMEGAKTITISNIGYKAQTITIGNQSTIDVALEEDTEALLKMAESSYEENLKNKDNTTDRKDEKNTPTEEKINEELEEELAIDEEDEELEMIAESGYAYEMARRSEERAITYNEIAELRESYDVLAAYETLQREEVRSGRRKVATVKPKPRNGMEAFKKYLVDSLKYPANSLQAGVEGKVTVRFYVEEDGSITNVDADNGLNYNCQKEAERLLKECGKWISGKTSSGESARARMSIPIHFTLKENFHNGLKFTIANNSNYSTSKNAPKFQKGRDYYSPVYQPTEKVETRTDFRPTIYWNPEVIVDQSGSAKVEFYNSDEVTTFRTVVEGFGATGTVGRKEHTYYTQLPFSMAIKVPDVLSFEDKVSIPLILKNNTDKPIAGKINTNTPKAFVPLGQFNKKPTIAAHSTATIYLDYEVSFKAGKGYFTASFEADGLSDSFSQIVEVKAKGFPATASFSGTELSNIHHLQIDQGMVPGSLTAQVTAYPDMLNELMAGIESILRQPSGCFEQTSSSTYPNILALQYIQESRTSNPEIEAKANAMIKRGYDKLVAFETTDKGYEWYGSTPPHESLTAYGLMEFTDMSEIYASVDNKMVARTKNWILSRRDGNGGFKHAKGKYSFSRPKSEVRNAYVVYALSETGYNDLNLEIKNVHAEAMASNDAYRMACLANTYFNIKDYKKGNLVLNKLKAQIKSKGIDGLTSDHSITYSGGKSLKVETIALITLAMIHSNEQDISAIRKNINYLAKARGNYGGFGSTQATILSLKALTEFAKIARKTKSGGTIEINLNGKKIGSKRYRKNTMGDITIKKLGKHFTEGKNSIDVKLSGTTDPLPHSIDVSWSIYTPRSDEECKVDIETSIPQKKIKVGETVRMNISLTNKTAEGLPSTMAKVGIPSGLSLQPWQLKELQEKEVFDFYEIRKNYIYFYYRGMLPSEAKTIHLDLKAEIPGEYEAPANCSYLYYTDEFKDWSGGEKIIINR